MSGNLMNYGWRISLLLLALLTVAACVSTGPGEIARPAVTDRLEAGKSTKGEVAAALGFPALVTYGPQGAETWDYYYVTEYPTPVDLVPVVNALSPGMNQGTKVLTVSYDLQGVVQNLQKSQLSGRAGTNPY